VEDPRHHLFGARGGVGALEQLLADRRDLTESGKGQCAQLRRIHLRVAVGDAEVTIENFVFEPADISVKSGTRIVFRNKDRVPHSIIGEIGGRELFRSPDQLGEDETYAVVASNAGEISYYCGLHPGMKGKISVSK